MRWDLICFPPTPPFFSSNFLLFCIQREWAAGDVPPLWLGSQSQAGPAAVSGGASKRRAAAGRRGSSAVLPAGHVGFSRAGSQARQSFWCFARFAMPTAKGRPVGFAVGMATRRRFDQKNASRAPCVARPVQTSQWQTRESIGTVRPRGGKCCWITRSAPVSRRKEEETWSGRKGKTSRDATRRESAEREHGAAGAPAAGPSGVVPSCRRSQKQSRRKACDFFNPPRARDRERDGSSSTWWW
jgi:hypothetical protein